MEGHALSDVNLCRGCEISYLDSKDYSEELVFNFLLEHGVIKSSLKCPRCGSKIKLDSNKKFITCGLLRVIDKKKKRRCNFRKSVWSKTFFHHSQLPVSTVFRLVSAIVWLLPPRKKVILQEDLKKNKGVFNWFLAVRGVFVDSVSENSKKLGGKDQVVELVEAKWEPKDSNEKLWDWAFGGIDRQSGETFLVPVEYHNIESLTDIISQKINPGTVIVTTCTQSLTLEQKEEIKNSLSVSFVQPEFSTINKIIKHHWSEVHKKVINNLKRPPHSINQVAEYLFKSKHPVQAQRLHAFFVAAGRLYPPGKYSQDSPKLAYIASYFNFSNVLMQPVNRKISVSSGSSQ